MILEHWPDAPEIHRSADLYEDLIRCCVADAMSEVFILHSYIIVRDAFGTFSSFNTHVNYGFACPCRYTEYFSYGTLHPKLLLVFFPFLSFYFP